MQLAHAITSLEAAVDTQLRIAGPEIADAGTQLLAALNPAIRQTMMEVVGMAVTEISNQLDAQTVDIKLVDGDPELVVRDDSNLMAPPHLSRPRGVDEADEARITVRLPGYLKDLISSEAESSGDSVNAYVVDVLSSKTRRRGSRGTQAKTTLEL